MFKTVVVEAMVGWIEVRRDPIRVPVLPVVQGAVVRAVKHVKVVDFSKEGGTMLS